MALPLPVPPGPGGDFLAALNANRQSEAQRLQNQLLSLQAHYYPYETQANIASKSAYAQFMAPQAAAKLISNPQIMASLSSEQQNALRQSAAGLSQNAIGGQFAANIPPPPQSLGQQLIGGLLGRLGFNNQQQNPMANIPQQIPMPQQRQAQPEFFPESDYERPPTPREKRLQGYANEGGNITQTPYPTNAPQEVVATGKGRETRIQANEKIWANQLPEISNQATNSLSTLENLNRFHDSFERLKSAEKGPIFGRLPAISSAAQEADQAIADFKADALRSWQSQHINKADLKFADTWKASRQLNDEAEHRIVNFMSGVQRRKDEKLSFMSQAYDNGLSYAEASKRWNNFVKDKPIWNARSGNLNENNISDWQSYLSGGRTENARSNEVKRLVYNPQTGRLE